MFDKGESYNKNAHFQQEVASRLIFFAREDILKSANLLDVGCGTGFAGKEALKVNPDLIIHGVDKSLELLAITRNFYDKTFHVEIENFVPEAKYDIAISSMCLQWCRDINLAIEQALKASKIFYFAIPQPESLSEITQCFKNGGFKSPILTFKRPLNLKPFAVQTFEQNFSSLILALKSFNSIGIKNPNAEPISHSQIKLISKDFPGKISWNIAFYKSF
jgi:SAM-dependent methyltransferase